MISNSGSMKCGGRCEHVCLQIGQYKLKYHMGGCRPEIRDPNTWKITQKRSFFPHFPTPFHSSNWDTPDTPQPSSYHFPPSHYFPKSPGPFPLLRRPWPFHYFNLGQYSSQCSLASSLFSKKMKLRKLSKNCEKRLLSMLEDRLSLMSTVAKRAQVTKLKTAAHKLTSRKYTRRRNVQLLIPWRDRRKISEGRSATKEALSGSKSPQN